MGDKIRKTIAYNLDKDIKFIELDFKLYQLKSSRKAKVQFKTYSNRNRDTLKDEEKIQFKIYSNQNRATLNKKKRKVQSKIYSNQDGATLNNQKIEAQSKL